MGLPWARLDANIASHDKILWLRDQGNAGWKACAVYVFGLAWSVGHGTNGHIPPHAAKYLEADKRTAALLVTCGLWEPSPPGWVIRNFAEYQQLDEVTDAKKGASQRGGHKGACRKWHGPDCWDSTHGCTWVPNGSPNGSTHMGTHMGHPMGESDGGTQ